MNRAAATLSLFVIAAGLWFATRPESPDRSDSEARAIWDQQLKAVVDGQSTQIVMPDLRVLASCLPELKPIAEQLTELNLSGDHLSQEIEEIVACSHLKILHLRTELGDAEITRLAQLRELEVLDLPLAMNVTDAGLKALTEHPRLRLIRLRAPRVTDEGLPVFHSLPALRWLHLMEIPLTDRGLEVFRTMNKLESLYLDGDRATDEGLSNLVLARPDLHFHRDQLHLSVDPRQRDGHRD